VAVDLMPVAIGVLAARGRAVRVGRRADLVAAYGSGARRVECARCPPSTLRCLGAMIGAP
jgi:hypothetical protein